VRAAVVVSAPVVPLLALFAFSQDPHGHRLDPLPAGSDAVTGGSGGERTLFVAEGRPWLDARRLLEAGTVVRVVEDVPGNASPRPVRVLVTGGALAGLTGSVPRGRLRAAAAWGHRVVPVTGP
jgi:hypothetical protein